MVENIKILTFAFNFRLFHDFDDRRSSTAADSGSTSSQRFTASKGNEFAFAVTLQASVEPAIPRLDRLRLLGRHRIENGRRVVSQFALLVP